MQSVHRLLSWLGTGLVVAVGLGVVLLILSPIILKAKVDAEIAAIKARGEPVTLADLAVPRVPDDQNGAVVYERIFREMEKPQAKKDFDRLREVTSKTTWAGNAGLVSEVSAITARYAWMLPATRQAISKPHCRFNVPWEEGPMGITLPHLFRMRRLVSLLCATAVIKAKSGDMDGAMQCVKLGLAMSESLRLEAYHSSQLTRMGQVSSLLSSLQQCLRYGRVSERQASEICGALCAVDTRESLTEALKDGRVSGILIYDAILTHPDDIPELMDGRPGSYARIMAKPTGRVSAFGRLLFRRDELFFIRTMNDWIGLADLPPHRVGRERLAAQSDPDIPKYAFLSAMFLPVHGRKHWDVADAKVNSSRVLLSAIAYRDRFGEYPSGLGELKAKLGWKIPEDPFSGRDFVYRREGKGFILYSIGPDMKDDGGMEPPKDDKDKGDIVWRMER